MDDKDVGKVGREWIQFHLFLSSLILAEVYFPEDLN